MYYWNVLRRVNRNLPGVIIENLGGKGYVIQDTTENMVVQSHPPHNVLQRNHCPPVAIAGTVVQQVPASPN